tara:strand:+ start:235 stop:867 length:633 start_codon:yes stop_codon:yes gene_type:complete
LIKIIHKKTFSYLVSNYINYNVFMEQLSLNIASETKFKIIASSAYDFRIELISQIGETDVTELIHISENLADVFGDSLLLTKENILKYFNTNTYPFVARYKGKIIGYIIGAPLEYFEQESWARYDANLFKKNTIYTYAFVVTKKYRKFGGYSKTLKKIYLNWLKKNGFKYNTGHVMQGTSKKFSKDTEIIKIFPTWYGAKTPFEYYRRPL